MNLETIYNEHIPIDVDWTIGTFISILYLSTGINEKNGFIITDKYNSIIWDSQDTPILTLENYNPSTPIKTFLAPGARFSSKMNIIQPLGW